MPCENFPYDLPSVREFIQMEIIRKNEFALPKQLNLSHSSRTRDVNHEEFTLGPHGRSVGILLLVDSGGLLPGINRQEIHGCAIISLAEQYKTGMKSLVNFSWVTKIVYTFNIGFGNNLPDQFLIRLTHQIAGNKKTDGKDEYPLEFHN
jgi:hypothetical protein